MAAIAGSCPTIHLKVWQLICRFYRKPIGKAGKQIELGILVSLHAASIGDCIPI